MFIVYLTLITSLVVSLFHFSLTVSGIGVLWLILNTLVKLIGHWEGAFDLGLFNMKYRSNRLLHPFDALESIMGPPSHPLQDLLPPT